MKRLTNTQLIVAAIVVIVLILIIYNSVYGSSVSILPKTSDTTNTNTNTGSGGNSTQSIWPLKLGSKGNEVLTIQRYLNKFYGAGLDEDSDFGPMTLAAVKKYLGVTQITKQKYTELIYPAGLPDIYTGLRFKAYGQYN